MRAEKKQKTSRMISWQSVVITMESWWTIKDTISHLRHTVLSVQLCIGSYLCSDFSFGRAAVGKSNSMNRENRHFVEGTINRDSILSPLPCHDDCCRPICSLKPALSALCVSVFAAHLVTGRWSVPSRLHPVLKCTRQESCTQRHTNTHALWK